MPEPSPVHVFGIRHHGPGSARSLVRALQELQPDVLLVEGPPDAAPVVPLLAHVEMRPPVALLVYVPDEPSRSAYYPFALFSPETQALRYGLEHHIPVRFMDLPLSHRFALQPTVPESAAAEESEGSTEEEETAPDRDPAPEAATNGPDGSASDGSAPEVQTADPPPWVDPLRWLAQAAGYGDSERWWDHLVEQRRDGQDLFPAILEAMTVLRGEVDAAAAQADAAGDAAALWVRDRKLEDLREAYMRQTIRAVVKEGHQRIAVVCGAWHAPVLTDLKNARADSALLQGLPKVKTQATWVPWTHGRLCSASGYGAGIESPGWYEHLWSHPDETAIRWMTRVARLFREEDFDASSAHVIEAIRLADSLASVRDRPLPGLEELNEASQAVLCFGDPLPMRLIHDRLIVGEVLGRVPDETPSVPLQADLQREQKRLRLPPEAGQKELDLDLRKPNDLERSYLLHRLNLLDVPWGRHETVRGKSGTFHEVWRLQWQPEFAVAIIEAAVWGNTLPTAATARAKDLAARAAGTGSFLATLTELLDGCLLANLPDAVTDLMERLQAEAAVSGDVVQLMTALPPLARVMRYGNVRQTDTSVVGEVVEGLVARIAIGLPGACASLNDEAADEMAKRVSAVHDAVKLLQQPGWMATWTSALSRVSAQPGVHGLVAGLGNRILLDQKVLEPEETARRMALALSRSADPAHAAAWVDGFLGSSGTLLLHDDALWAILDEWVSELSSESFPELLPLLRRTFSRFPAPERRQMGERVRRGSSRGTAGSGDEEIDVERADRVLPLIARLLGLDTGREAPVGS